MRAGGVCKTTPLSSVTCQFIKHNQHAFRHDAVRSVLVHRAIIMSLFIRVSAVATPAGSLSGTRTQHGNTKAVRDQTENAAHSNRRLLYLIATPCQLKDQNIARRSWPGRRQTAQLVTNRCPIMSTNQASSGRQSCASEPWLFLLGTQPS